MKTLELMRIDMANFTIRMSRPHIAACSVEYERNKFEDYLKITPGRFRQFEFVCPAHALVALTIF